jgi:DNA-binding transcriptional MerR regulator
MGVGRLDDQDYPALTTGQAAELLEVQPAFLRSLDAAGVLTPHRSSGGHRRYSRRQLALAARLRELVGEGLTLEAADRIVGLQDQLDTAHARIDELRTHHDVPPGAPHPTTTSKDSAAGRERTDVASRDRPPQQ